MTPRVKLPTFEGPLGLLLHLIEKQELDITTISLVAVTDQYLNYVHSLENIEPDILVEFIVIAAKLIYIKSRCLLPQPAAPVETVVEEEDPGEDLARQLLEYNRFKEVIQTLKEIQEEGRRAYPRPTPLMAAGPASGLEGVDLSDLLNMLNQTLERLTPQPRGEVNRQVVRLEERLVYLREQLVRHQRLSFRRLLAECTSRLEVVVSFLALLELLKQREVRVTQEGLFTDIQIEAV